MAPIVTAWLSCRGDLIEVSLVRRLSLVLLVLSLWCDGWSAWAACLTEPPLDAVYGWPREAAAPVAPVKLSWQYAPLRNPVWLEHTGRSIYFEIPDEYEGGGFQLRSSANSSGKVYRLRSVEVRAPGLHYGAPGGDTVGPRPALELLMVHQQDPTVDGHAGQMAVIALPFVEADGPVAHDPLLPLLPLAAGGGIPSIRGQRKRGILRGGPFPLDLASSMPRNSSFLHFWGSFVAPPCGPDGVTRHLIRRDAIPVGQSSIDPFLDVLRSSSDAAAAAEAGIGSAALPPRNVWRVGTCDASSNCTGAIPGSGLEATKAQLTSARAAADKLYQSARANLTKRIAKMNASLAALQAKKLTLSKAQQSSVLEDSAQMVQARADSAKLREVQDEVSGLRDQVVAAQADLDALANKSANWDDGRPSLVTQAAETTGAASSSELPVVKRANEQMSNGTAQNISSEASSGNVSGQANATALLSLLLGAEESRSEADSSTLEGQCASAGSPGASPIRIQSSGVADLSLLSEVSSGQVSFRYDQSIGILQRRRLKLENLGYALRITGLPADDAAPGGPLGEAVVNGSSYDLVAIELKLPGEHSIDGASQVAEMQLLHEPQVDGEGPVLALAIPLKELDDGNAWLEMLATQLPGPGEEAEVYGAPLWQVSRSLARPGSTLENPEYFRYDGSTTSPPCKSAKWFVLAEPGYVSTQQLDALRLVLTNVGRTTRFAPLGDRIVVRDSFIPLERHGAQNMLSLLRNRRKRDYTLQPSW